MEYERFESVFNETIFEESKTLLIEKISKHPNRYIGLFRPTKPKAKILQNLLQSHEIRFGDAFEKIIEEYLKINNYNILNKRFSNEESDELNIDQCFKDEKNFYFIEQKIRDDHDSTKKKGQIDNFEEKLNAMIKRYGETNLFGFFYFIDPNLKKNKNYYKSKLEEMEKDYGVKLFLFYGRELFEFLGVPNIWDELLTHLEQWKKSIPELPEVNFDKEPLNSFQEIKDLDPVIYRRLFKDEAVFNNMVLSIFPQKETLKLLLEYFKKKSSEKQIYKTLYNTLKEKIE